MLTQARLHELLHYNPETGLFTRLIATSRSTKVGTNIGYKHHTGYLYAMIDSKTYAVHRLAWLYVHGHLPNGDIDHINGITDDNRITNLRDVSQKTNAQNERKARVTSASGFLGVHWRKDRSKWIAVIKVNGREKKLGSFDNPEDAHQAYLKAKRFYHEGCTI